MRSDIGKAHDELTKTRHVILYSCMVWQRCIAAALDAVFKGKAVNLHWLSGFYIYGDDAYGSSIFSKIVQGREDGKKEFPFTREKNMFIHVSELAKTDCEGKYSEQT